MKTLDDVLASVTAEKTAVESLITLTNGIKAELDGILAGALPPDAQAKVDALFAGVEANKAEIVAAITANTPAAAPAAPLAGGISDVTKEVIPPDSAA